MLKFNTAEIFTGKIYQEAEDNHYKDMFENKFYQEYIQKKEIVFALFINPFSRLKHANSI